MIGRRRNDNAFTTRQSRYTVVEMEGPPEPPELTLARVRAWYAEQGMPYEDEDEVVADRGRD